MAAAQVVITNTDEHTPAVGGLFEGLSFFLVQRLPSRSAFIEKIQSNGGRVVRVENQADHVIADHYRKDCPAGSISYTFIDTAITNGELPDPNQHRAGAPEGTIRDVGSTAIPGKSTRTPFSAEDDRVLWQWVKRCEAQGGLIKGNEIYKQLEAKNSRHTYQAWRDRYIKKLIDKPPAGVELQIAANAPPSPPTAQDERKEVVAGSAGRQDQARQSNHEWIAEAEGGEGEGEEGEPEFTEDDMETLLGQARDIESVVEDRADEAWEAWAQAYPQHSADVWKEFYVAKVRPVYLERRAERKRKRKARGEPASSVNADSPSNVNKRQDNKAADQPAAQKATTPERPSSSGSQSMKRKVPEPATAASHRSKRQRSDHAASPDPLISNDKRPTQNGKAAQKPSTQPISIASDSEDEEASGQAGQPIHYPQSNPTKNDYPLGGLSKDPGVYVASEPNAEAQAEFDEEVLGIPRAQYTGSGLLGSNLPTSDANRAADQQLRRESIERENEMQEETSQPETPDLLRSQANNVATDEFDDQRAQESQESNGHALTEANLASQQAQQKKPQLRGTDLPEDDDDVQGAERQDEFAKYLHGLVMSPGGSRGAQNPSNRIEEHTTGRLEDNLAGADPDLPFFRVGDEHDGNPMDVTRQPEMSSQEELDDVLDEILQWPSSPEQPQRKMQESQSFQFETQIPYPHLPEQDGSQMMNSQVDGAQEVTYPALPAQQEEPVTTYQESVDEDDLPPQYVTTTQSQFLEQESSYAFVNDGSQSTPLYLGSQSGKIDLSIPEPEGGWDDSSSVANAMSSQGGFAPISQHAWNSAPQANKPEDVEESVRIIKRRQDAIEVSSNSSSSSNEDRRDGFEEENPIAARKKALETQDIINAETQQPDFDMPLPPDSASDPDSEDDLPSDPLQPPSSPPPPNFATIESQRALATTQTLPDADLNAYIDRMVVFGHKEASIINALKCTSMRPDLAELVLLEEKGGKAMPKDVAGIWSVEEDEVLESGNARGLRRLEEKHSWRECEERMQFLEDWREDEEDERES